MGFLDRIASWKGRTGGSTASVAAPPVADCERGPRVFHQDPDRLFNPDSTRDLREIFSVPKPQRTPAWQGAFFHAVWDAALEAGTPTVIRGPDGFPYRRLQCPAPAQNHEPVSLGSLASDLAANNEGVAVFASAEATEPEYVMSTGVVDSLLRYDSWQGDPVDLGEIAQAGEQTIDGDGMKKFVSTKPVEILVGVPSPALLPGYTAQGLYLFIKDRWGVAEPRISLMINPATAPTRSFVLNRKLSEFASPQAAAAEARALLWYLPPNRGLILMPESWKQDDMTPLTDLFPG